MARAAIGVGQTDDLPGICVKTGVPTTRTRSQEFAEVPGWTLLLIFWGVIPFLIAAGLARRKVNVDLPATEETLRSTRRVDRGSILGLVLVVGLLAAAWITRETGLVIAAAALLLVTLFGSSIARRLVWVTGRLEDDVLWLYGVHPTFAREVEQLAPRDLEARIRKNRWLVVVSVIAVLVLAILVILFMSPGA
jgi:hypothetical protein